MKQLIIGIDGGDRQIFERMPMPFVKQLLKDNCSQELTEDLLSRGWVEILSGKYARDTKAFYMVPQCNGTNEIKFKYSLSELLNNEEVTPIWQVPTNNAKVAMMNVPTTFPAQPVNGFFVSGAGGGVNKVDGIPPELCHPQSLAKDLEEMGYEIDIRFGTAGLTDIGELFRRLERMLRKRTDAFLQLATEHKLDFGFLTLRAPTVVQYLAMSEMQAYFQRKSGHPVPTHASTQQWEEGFERLYATLDDCIKQVIEATCPEHWILTSDHGAVPYRYQMNIDRFLQDHGFQPYKISWKKTLRKFAARVIKSKPFAPVRIAKNDQSTAFGHWYLSGIFVNDAARFGGPVSEADVNKITDELCQRFNSTQEASQYEMQAKPYRSQFEGAKFHSHLPDVKIHCSDEIFCASGPGAFIRANPGYAPLPSIAKIQGGMHSGQKGRHPVFCCDMQTGALISDQDPLDLTLVYKLTERIFGDKT